MSDSRCLDRVARGVLGGGRESTSRRPAGALSHNRGGTRARVVTALAGLALLGVQGPARAQEPAAPPQGASIAESVQPLSAKYRFIESYGMAEDLARPGLMIQYQVGSIETIRRELEKARGAPDRQEIEYRTIYTERPARLGRVGDVTDSVRQYDMFRIGGAPPDDPRTAILLRGLRLWYHLRSSAAPELISLTPNRPIRQREYDMVQSQLFLPRLTTVFPSRPVRVKDTWPISRPAARALMRNVPDAGDLQLEGSLVRIDKAAEGTSLTAIINVSGELAFEDGEGALQAQLSFVFEPLPAASTDTPKTSPDVPGRGASARDPELIEARGYTAKVIMSLRKTVPLDDEGRLQEIQTGELQLHRRRVIVQPGGDEAGALTVPEKPPVADESNSWLLYDDPQGRFHLRHHQDLTIQDLAPGDDLEMVVRRPNGSTDVLVVTPVPKEKDSSVDRRRSDPQAFLRDLKDQWSREGYEVYTVPPAYLPEAEWAPLKRRVFRVEAAIKPDADGAAVRGAARFYLDAYLVAFSRGDVFYIKAITDRDDHVTFRNQAESLIRSLELGPSHPAMALSSGRPSPTRPPATPPSADRPTAPPVPRLDRRP